MSYTRTTLGPRGRGPTTLSGVSSQPPGRRVSSRALVQMAGVSSRPRGRRVSRKALGAANAEYGQSVIAQIGTAIVSGIKDTFGGGKASGGATGWLPVGPKPATRTGPLPVASRIGVRGTLGDAPTVVDPSGAAFAGGTASADLAVLDQRTKAILARLDEDAKNRKIALMIAGASALFAAVKLGFIAIPHLRGATKL